MTPVIPQDKTELIISAMRAKRAELQHAPLDRIYGELFEAGAIALMAPESNNDPVLNFIAGNDTSELARCQASEAYMSGALSRELELHEETRQELETVRANCAATSNSYLARALAAEEKLAALGDTHVMARDDDLDRRLDSAYANGASAILSRLYASGVRTGDHAAAWDDCETIISERRKRIHTGSQE